MRILYCGCGDFAVAPFRAIVADGHELTGVITSPPRPAGRGGNLRLTPLAEAARTDGLDVMPTSDINAAETLQAVRRMRPDVIVVVDFGQFISRPVREAAGLGALNVHASLLPELRGAAPINWAIIRGCQVTGVTTFRLVDRMDAGPIYAAERTAISPEETAGDLARRLAEIGAGLLCRTLTMLADGRAGTHPQDESKATRAPKLTKADGRIDFSADAVTVRNLIHGTWPWPGGQAVFRRADGSEVPVTIARAVAETGDEQGRPGRIDGRLTVATGRGRLRIVQLRPAGKKLMTWRDFVNGYRVAAGDRFLRPG